MRLPGHEFVGFMIALALVAVAALPWFVHRTPDRTLHVHTIRIEEADVSAICRVHGEVETCTFSVPVER